MPEFRFQHPIEIRYGDLDPQDHVNNASYLTYFEQARVQYLIHLGLFTEGQSFMGIGIILADAHILFKAPIHFGQTVKVGVRISRLGRKSMTSEYVIRDEQGQEYASGSSVLVTFDYTRRQTIPIPESWREKILQFEETVEIK